MKIAIPIEEPRSESAIDPRFGRARFFMIYDNEKDSWEFIDNNQNYQAAQGAGIQSAANVVNAGCGVLLSGHCGPKAFATLSKVGVKVFLVKEGAAHDAIKLYKKGLLKEIKAADVDGHW